MDVAPGTARCRTQAAVFGGDPAEAACSGSRLPRTAAALSRLRRLKGRRSAPLAKEPLQRQKLAYGQIRAGLEVVHQSLEVLQIHHWLGETLRHPLPPLRHCLGAYLMQTHGVIRSDPGWIGGCAPEP